MEQEFSRPPPQSVDLGHAWGTDEFLGESGDVVGMDVVPHLLAVVTVHPVQAAGHVDLHEVAQESVQLDGGVGRTRQAATTQATTGEAEARPVSCTMTSPASLDAPNKECLD